MLPIARHGAPRSSKRVASDGLWRRRCDKNAFDRLMSFPSRAVGVGHPPYPTPTMISSDTARWSTRRPAGVINTLQVAEHFVEPTAPSRCRNLLSKDDWRAADFDEPKPGRPKMPRIGVALSATLPYVRVWPRLTGAASGPDVSVIRPSGESERVTPSPDAGEEMALGESSNIVGWYLLDVSLINFAIGYQSCLDQFAQPGGSKPIVLVVVRTHAIRFAPSPWLGVIIESDPWGDLGFPLRHESLQPTFSAPSFAPRARSVSTSCGFSRLHRSQLASVSLWRTHLAMSGFGLYAAR
jgi:hypothetical protein